MWRVSLLSKVLPIFNNGFYNTFLESVCELNFNAMGSITMTRLTEMVSSNFLKEQNIHNLHYINTLFKHQRVDDFSLKTRPSHSGTCSFTSIWLIMHDFWEEAIICIFDKSLWICKQQGFEILEIFWFELEFLVHHNCPNCFLDGLRSMGGHRFIKWFACNITF